MRASLSLAFSPDHANLPVLLIAQRDAALAMLVAQFVDQHLQFFLFPPFSIVVKQADLFHDLISGNKLCHTHGKSSDGITHAPVLTDQIKGNFLYFDLQKGTVAEGGLSGDEAHVRHANLNADDLSLEAIPSQRPRHLVRQDTDSRSDLTLVDKIPFEGLPAAHRLDLPFLAKEMDGFIVNTVRVMPEQIPMLSK